LDGKITDIQGIKRRKNILTRELRLRIVNRIRTIEDDWVLEEINKFIDRESEMTSVYRLTVDERKAVAIGLENIKPNNVFSSTAADNLLEEWLRK